VVIPVLDGLRDICKLIVSEHKSQSEWALIESDDMFANGPYVGGFDADENEFCFSYYDDRGHEYWFQFTIDEATVIAAGDGIVLSGRPASK